MDKLTTDMLLLEDVIILITLGNSKEELANIEKVL